MERCETVALGLIAVWVALCLTLYAWTFTPQAQVMLTQPHPGGDND
jgi:hypothetical protein